MGPPLRTVSVAPLADTEPERATLPSDRSHHTSSRPRRGRRDETRSKPHHPPNEGYLISRQRTARRVRFTEPPTHCHHPDSTPLSQPRAERRVGNKHPTCDTVGSQKPPRRTGQVSSHVAVVQHRSMACVSPGTIYIGAGVESKTWNGIKYERKTKRPLVGRLESQGRIINIDGEDYVEYRVLL
ncbi:hypothetical protein PCL_09510 [Purpureocillium lilacinum]|uniref:Uncharacterized protein n=1 Tax=Purpureocillium lilacinum TaxID=33203 RepID=A0A2U3DQQ2_PURLI|nr:hypothetical protein PCL_09510 [Purpureocillium lilacinum]